MRFFFAGSGLTLVLTSLLACAGATPSGGSIGAKLGRDNDTHAVYAREVPEGLAASVSGMEPDDEILMVDGFYVRTMSAQELQAKLRGEVGSTVQVTVARGRRVLRLAIKRTPLQSEPPPKAKEERVDGLLLVPAGSVAYTSAG